MTETLWLKSSELRPGDVVLTHGMRLLIDQEIKSYPGTYGTVYATPAKVTNPEEVKAEAFIPWSWLFPDVWGKGERGGWGKDWDADPRWDVQGNDNAYWTVERTA